MGMACRFSCPASLGAIILIFLACAPGASAVHEQRRPTVSRDTQAAPLIAPPAACPLQESLSSSPEGQEQAMLCMIDYARQGAGLASLTPVESLTSSADLKSRDILACDDFSHFACGRPFSYWIRATGYTSVPCWRIGEIIAYGRGQYGTPRSIFIAWMQSPTHRRIILNEFTQVGLSVRLGNLGIYGWARVWAGHFGTQCESTA
jgi:uncharacterized protein YkwD